jgi:hypothetical protein
VHNSILGGIVNAAQRYGGADVLRDRRGGDAVKVYLNGSTTPSYSTVANASGAWSVRIGVLANGAYSYTATATDPAGDTSASSAALKFTVSAGLPRGWRAIPLGAALHPARERRDDLQLRRSRLIEFRP